MGGKEEYGREGGREGGEAAMQFHCLVKVLPGPQDFAVADI